MITTDFYNTTPQREGSRNILVAGPRVETEREHKTIGIEIEFFGVHKDTVITALRRAGIEVAWMGYTHRVVRHWKLVTDVSVTGAGTGVGKGLELVSPPLTEAQMTVELKVVCEVLEQIGAKVDRTCGVHVHHDIDDLTVENVKNIYKIYDKHELAIEAIIPRSRRGFSMNRYCRKITGELLDRVLSFNTIKGIAKNTDRYYTINMQSYVKYGTVEFRQHSGSTDYTKLINWIKITQAIVATAKRKKKINPLPASVKSLSSMEMALIKELSLTGTEQSAYYFDRKKTFRELNKQAYERAAA